MKKVWRGITEVGFIVFLFYSNLLMGEFEHSGQGYSKGLVWSIWNICTAANLGIALVAAFLGYVFFETLRKAFQRESNVAG